MLNEDGWQCRVADVISGRYRNRRFRSIERWLPLLKVSPNCTGAVRSLMTVHHTLGKRVTGDDPAYLFAACRACNLGMGDPSAADPPHRVMTNW